MSSSSSLAASLASVMMTVARSMSWRYSLAPSRSRDSFTASASHTADLDLSLRRGSSANL